MKRGERVIERRVIFTDTLQHASPRTDFQRRSLRAAFLQPPVQLQPRRVESGLIVRVIVFLILRLVVKIRAVVGRRRVRPVRAAHALAFRLIGQQDGDAVDDRINLAVTDAGQLCGIGKVQSLPIHRAAGQFGPGECLW